MTYEAVVHGVPARVYRQVMRAERTGLYASAERSNEMLERYSTGLFSCGRPGVLVSELKNKNYEG